MKLKQLASKSGVYLDPDDLEKFGELGAWIHLDGYILTYNPNTREELKLAQLVMNTSTVVDHINGNTTDDRKANLRLATKSQNMANVPLRSDNKSGYKGVYFNKSTARYTAYITKDQIRIHIGSFKTAEAAAKAYNAKAVELFGDFAYLNTVKELS